MRCFMLACSGTPYPYWQANALQALSEHLQSPSLRSYLIRNNWPSIKYLNIDQVPDSLLAGNLAQMALNLFSLTAMFIRQPELTEHWLNATGP